MPVLRILAGLVALGVIFPDLGRADVVVVPFEACGWKWFQPPGSYDEHAWSRTTYDDSAWSTGCAPFVAPWSCEEPGTTVPLDAPVLLRRHIWNLTGAPVTVFYEVRALGQISVHYNGLEGNGGGLGDECPPRNRVTGGMQLNPGDNVILVSAVSMIAYAGGNVFYLGGNVDVRLTSDSITEARPSTWGSVKTLYR